MPELYQLPLSAPWGSWQVVLVANWQDRPRGKSLELARLGLPADRPLHVFDFWGRACFRHTGPVLDLGTLAPHASRLLRLCPADRPGPCLAGSTLHITQGLEVTGLESEPLPAGPARRSPACTWSCATWVARPRASCGWPRRAETLLWSPWPRGGRPGFPGTYRSLLSSFICTGRMGRRPASMPARWGSRNGGRARLSPRWSASSSVAKPGPSVAISKSTPPGSRK